MLRHRWPVRLAAWAVLATAFVPGLAGAQKRYDSGASDTEIRIGNIAPYTGPFSAFAAEALVEADYFRMINERGGIHGRRITFVSVDAAADPARSLRAARQLVEQDGVLALFGIFGHPANL